MNCFQDVYITCTVTPTSVTHQHYQSVPISIIWKGRYMKFPNCCGIVTEGIQDEQFQDIKKPSNPFFSRIKSVHSSLHCWTIVPWKFQVVFLDLYRSLFYLPFNRVLNRLSGSRKSHRALLLNSMAEFQVGRGCPSDGWMNMWQMFTDVYPNWLSWCSWWDV